MEGDENEQCKGACSKLDSTGLITWSDATSLPVQRVPEELKCLPDAEVSLLKV